MRVIKIEGGKRLSGNIDITGAKNSVVALISAAILSNEIIIIEDVPEISDVRILIELFEDLNAKIIYKNNILTIDSSNLIYKDIVNTKVQKLRASYYLLGAMVGRFKKARVGMCGGCYLGPRPIDLHLKGFKSLNINVEHSDGSYILYSDRIIGTTINLDISSVGATINIILASVYSEGLTFIENAATEPEIIDLVTLLNGMGAKITGAGTDLIKIEGVEYLGGCRHQIIPDRIVAGSYILAGALLADELTINNVIPEHLEAFLAKLQELGVEFKIGEDFIKVKKIEENCSIECKNDFSIKAMSYPGFPTDLQQPFTVLLTQIKGTSFIYDMVYSARFKHVEELTRMGANITDTISSAIINGKTKLKGTKVTATDLRGGFAMILAGLIADGITEIKDIEHIERGYENVVNNFKKLGANIWIEEIEDDY